MRNTSKPEAERLRKKYDSAVEKILFVAVQHKAKTVNIFQTSKEVKGEIILENGSKKPLAEYSITGYKGLINRIKYMANLPLRRTKANQRGMIQVCLTLPQGEKFIAFYVEVRDGAPEYKQHLILAPIWVSLSAC